MYSIAHMYRSHAFCGTHVIRSDDNLWELVFFFPPCEAQATRIGGNCPYPLSHLAGPVSVFIVLYNLSGENVW